MTRVTAKRSRSAARPRGSRRPTAAGVGGRPPNPRAKTLIYWLLLLGPIALQISLVYLAWKPYVGSAGTFASRAFTWGQAIWFLPAFWAVTNLWGLVRHGPPADRRPGPDWRWDPAVSLIVAYVSRGQNQLALKRASEETRRVLRRYGVRHTLELVTDVPVTPENRVAGDEVVYEVVPAEYESRNRVRYKGRALQYLLERRSERLAGTPEVSANAWVLHLDEESVVTPELVLGMAEFIEKHDLRRTPGAVGQGEILYNGYAYGRRPVIAAIDAVRTGDDLGRFRLQFGTFRRPPFGMHGSFVLVPARTEEQVTWDFGARGSVTEDAYFSLLAVEAGERFGWVEGFLREQSPFTLGDLVQQRRRWYSGLSLVAGDPRLSLRSTAVLRAFLLFWQCNWISCFFSVAALLYMSLAGRTFLPLWAALVAGLFSGVSAATYSVGAWRNAAHAPLSPAGQAKAVATAYLLWLLMIPAVVESFAVLYALLRPVKVFHVVAKDRLPT